jgi:hypothetical protein
MAKKKKTKKSVLAHHKHTGKVLPREHTSWPFVTLLLLMLGVLLSQITFSARAEDVVVTAAADGPLPPSAAIITDPVDGQVFTAIPITVKGTCPSPYLVKLYRDQLFSGSAQCFPDGTFQITTDLFVGENDLQARIYNYADQEGPASPPVTVTYNPPAPPASPGNPSNPGQGNPGGQGLDEPFFITTDKFYKANQDKVRIDWTFGIVGGNKPYNILVDWGDGTTSKLDKLIDSQFSVSHEYKKGNSKKDYFVMVVTVTDTRGRIATLQVFNILNYSDIPGAAASLPTGGTALPDSPGLWDRFRYYWIAYIVITLMAVSFWLGQHVHWLPIVADPRKKTIFPTIHPKH